MLRAEGQYLFIMCPNHSGSTVLYFLLASSEEVSTMNYADRILEGQIIPDVMRYMPYAKEEDRGLFSRFKSLHKNPKNYNWIEIKKAWRRHWDYNKSVLLEKSTTNLYRKKMLEDNFKNCKFICMVRNPYAVCEGIIRKHGVNIVDAVEHWIATAEQQIENISSNVLFFRYEDLCDNTDEVVGKIVEFIPQIKFLDFNKKLNRPRYENIVGLKNMNLNQIRRLPAASIVKMREKLSEKKDLMKFYGYEIL